MLTQNAIDATAKTTLLVLFLRHFEPLELPQTPYTLAVHMPALMTQQSPHPAIAVAWMASYQFQHPLQQFPFVVASAENIPLCPPRLIHDQAGTTLRDAQRPLDVPHRLPATRRG